MHPLKRRAKDLKHRNVRYRQCDVCKARATTFEGIVGPVRPCPMGGWKKKSTDGPNAKIDEDTLAKTSSDLPGQRYLFDSE